MNCLFVPENFPNLKKKNFFLFDLTKFRNKKTKKNFQVKKILEMQKNVPNS